MTPLRRRPPLPVVLAVLFAAIAIWPLIFHVAGRVVWLW